MAKHPAEEDRSSPSLPVLVKAVQPFIVGAPYVVPARAAKPGEIVAVEQWLAKDLMLRGLATPAA